VNYFIIIGLNYSGADYELKAAEKDAKFYEYQAISMEADYSVYKFIGRDELLSKMYGLISKLRAIDTLFFCFSGFGTKIGDKNAIVLFDNGEYEVVYEEELLSIFSYMKNNVVAIYDCGFGDKKRHVLKDEYERLTRKHIVFDNLGIESPDLFVINSKNPKRKQEVYLYASRDNYPALELESDGLFTYALKTAVFKKYKSIDHIIVNSMFTMRKYQQQPFKVVKNFKNKNIFYSNEISTSTNQSNR
jgi:hypothetical protein